MSTRGVGRDKQRRPPAIAEQELEVREESSEEREGEV